MGGREKNSTINFRGVDPTQTYYPLPKVRSLRDTLKDILSHFTTSLLLFSGEIYLMFFLFSVVFILFRRVGKALNTHEEGERPSDTGVEASGATKPPPTGEVEFSGTTGTVAVSATGTGTGTGDDGTDA